LYSLDSPVYHFVPGTSAQSNIPPKIQFKHLTKEDGLSGNSIWCVLKDRKGFIWIGTHEGLNRYDGIKFKEFKIFC
jgi:ligand-binding sensor domain-containing protein